MPEPVELSPPDFAGGAPLEEKLHPLEWVAAVTGAALFLAIVAFLAFGLMEWRRVQVPLLGGTLADQTQAIANFKSLSEVQSERMLKFLDLVITKTLGPVFTTVVGYLLGKRGK